DGEQVAAGIGIHADVGGIGEETVHHRAGEHGVVGEGRGGLGEVIAREGAGEGGGGLALGGEGGGDAGGDGPGGVLGADADVAGGEHLGGVVDERQGGVGDVVDGDVAADADAELGLLAAAAFLLLAAAFILVSAAGAVLGLAGGGLGGQADVPQGLVGQRLDVDVAAGGDFAGGGVAGIAGVADVGFDIVGEGVPADGGPHLGGAAVAERAADGEVGEVVGGVDVDVARGVHGGIGFDVAEGGVVEGDPGEGAVDAQLAGVVAGLGDVDEGLVGVAVDVDRAAALHQRAIVDGSGGAVGQRDAVVAAAERAVAFGAGVLALKLAKRSRHADHVDEVGVGAGVDVDRAVGGLDVGAVGHGGSGLVGEREDVDAAGQAEAAAAALAALGRCAGVDEAGDDVAEAQVVVEELGDAVGVAGIEEADQIAAEGFGGIPILLVGAAVGEGAGRDEVEVAELAGDAGERAQIERIRHRGGGGDADALIAGDGAAHGGGGGVGVGAEGDAAADRGLGAA